MSDQVSMEFPDLCAMCGTNPPEESIYQYEQMWQSGTKRHLEWTVPVCNQCLENYLSRRNKLARMITVVFAIAALAFMLFGPIDMTGRSMGFPGNIYLIGLILLIVFPAITASAYHIIKANVVKSPKLSTYDGNTVSFENKAFHEEFARLNPKLADTDALPSEPAEVEVAASAESEPDDFLSDSEEPEGIAYETSQELRDASNLASSSSTRQEGIDSLRKLVERYPESGDPASLLAQALVDAGKVEEARAILLDSYGKVARKGKVAGMLGDIYLNQLGDLAKASEWYVRSIHSQGNNPYWMAPYVYMAAIYSRCGGPDFEVKLHRIIDKHMSFSAGVDSGWIDRVDEMRTEEIDRFIYNLWLQHLQKPITEMM